MFLFNLVVTVFMPCNRISMQNILHGIFSAEFSMQNTIHDRLGFQCKEPETVVQAFALSSCFFTPHKHRNGFA